MTDVVFLQLDEAITSFEDEQLVNVLVAGIRHHYDHKRRISVLARDREQAHWLDELLWQLPPERFLAHQLVGEGAPNQAPIEIAYQSVDVNPRPVLFNLTLQPFDSLRSIRVLYDFVFADPERKQSARERFKHFRSQGANPRAISTKQLLSELHG